MVISCPRVPDDGKESVSLDGSVLIRDNKRVLNAAWANRHALVLVILLTLSAPLRLMNLGEPFVGEHEFRQTQTALSVWDMRAHGISLLHPKLPLFGPPWECPFEYPVFQLVAAAVDSIAPWKNLDISIRVTNLAFFYLTAVALYLLTRLLFRKPEVALFGTAVFLFSPYNIFWSRTSMIESAATFFALAYLVSFIRWTYKPGWPLFSLCLFFGILGCLTKITSFVIPIFIGCALLGLEAVRVLREFRSRGQRANSAAVTAAQSIGLEQANTRERGFRILGLTCLLLVPLLLGQCYTKYGDSIKEKSDYTRWLSSNHPYMKKWAYGTLEQRLDIRKWDILQHRIQGVVTPCFAIALVIGICALPLLIRGFSRLPLGNFLVGCSFVLAPIAAIGLFFNLYFIHTYYLNACAPFFALCAGTGLWLIFKSIRTVFLKPLYVLLLIGLWLWTASPQLAQACFTSKTDSRLDYLSAASKLIPPDEPVITLSATEWSSFAPYYLKRRAFMGMMFNKPVNIHQLVENDYFKKNGFHWLLIEGNAPGMPELAGEIIQRWKTSRLISVPVSGTPYLLYSLSDE
jgi:4-amino-4-deoxy-L-arabinose transferase and related glycosyltransferases of PMT family